VYGGVLKSSESGKGKMAVSSENGDDPSRFVSYS
jgi:hypothetical protein